MLQKITSFRIMRQYIYMCEFSDGMKQVLSNY